MIKRETYLIVGKYLVLFYLLLFPFGQLLRFGFSINLGNLQDVIVLFSLPFYFLSSIKKPKIDLDMKFFLGVTLLSTLISVNTFGIKEVLYGFLYIVRLVSYYTFGTLVYNLIALKVLKPGLLLQILIAVTVVVGVFGWFQYLFNPDLVFLKYMNWDDHLNRLVGTFLDPGFTGLILTFGLLLSIYFYIYKKQFLYGLVALFLLASILFTYSRASYLAVMFGMLPILNYKFRRQIPIFVAGILLAIFLLPSRLGEGTKILRTQSIYARFSDYQHTVEIIKKYPVFGVGFNNLCAAKVIYYNEKLGSHACSGSSSSILFVLATTGIVGFMVFVNILIKVWGSFEGDKKLLLRSFVLAILVHSLFVQSLFYSYVMGYFAIFIASLSKLRSVRNFD